MVRVSKVDARIVVGDEGIPPWVPRHQYAGILSTTNPQFLAEAPLASLPVSALRFPVRWVIGEVLPHHSRLAKASRRDFDFEIRAAGGSYRPLSGGAGKAKSGQGKDRGDANRVGEERVDFLAERRADG